MTAEQRGIKMFEGPYEVSMQPSEAIIREEVAQEFEGVTFSVNTLDQFYTKRGLVIGITNIADFAEYKLFLKAVEKRKKELRQDAELLIR